MNAHRDTREERTPSRVSRLETSFKLVGTATFLPLAAG